jgi:hypothetical protein
MEPGGQHVDERLVGPVRLRCRVLLALRRLAERSHHRGVHAVLHIVGITN